ncbi:multidrug efflux SMR transporter [Paenibacillus motobuensis]|uniref:DMT family transporter n=1 Tax=Paenibacillus TaxID=44249 RepID=UPI00203D89C3|nr:MULTISPECIES: multidrug efflux SMR transporter [Paenibacillus]MCM3039242.1 multidrug efflux SMR transporter [Paenibacillus lutimineralis]MCM3646346.1 multidrug efflux SMR transporter [Paenibacillus motobuensis]
MSGVLYLTLAIIFEGFATTMLKLSQGFTLLGPSIGVAVGYLISFTSLNFSLKYISLSTAYATWSGVGTALSVMIGIVVFGEHINLLKISAIVLVIIGIVVMNRAMAEKAEGKASSQGM